MEEEFTKAILKRPEVILRIGDKPSYIQIQGIPGQNQFWEGEKCYIPVLYKGQPRKLRVIVAIRAWMMVDERAERRAADKDALERFVNIEAQLINIIESFDKAKRGIRWLLGLLAANYVVTFSDFLGGFI